MRLFALFILPLIAAVSLVLYLLLWPLRASRKGR